MSSIIAKGAEAIIRKDKLSIIKDRIVKKYRFPELDEKIRRQRTKKEIKLLEKASKVIPVPKIIKSEEYKINLELIDGKKLSDFLDKLPNSIKICRQIGNNIAKLHDANIIHGDLTTSNMIYVKLNKKISKNKSSELINVKNNNDFKLYFIDFGLGFESHKIEDKAVDLHLIKQALEARHFEHFEKFFSAVLEGYKTSKNAKEILIRLEKVESRGRYKAQY